jgi:hypothetical protein
MEVQVKRATDIFPGLKPALPLQRPHWHLPGFGLTYSFSASMLIFKEIPIFRCVHFEATRQCAVSVPLEKN